MHRNRWYVDLSSSVRPILLNGSNAANRRGLSVPIDTSFVIGAIYGFRPFWDDPAIRVSLAFDGPPVIKCVAERTVYSDRILKILPLLFLIEIGNKERMLIDHGSLCRDVGIERAILSLGSRI